MGGPNNGGKCVRHTGTESVLTTVTYRPNFCGVLDPTKSIFCGVLDPVKSIFCGVLGPVAFHQISGSFGDTIRSGLCQGAPRLVSGPHRGNARWLLDLAKQNVLWFGTPSSLAGRVVWSFASTFFQLVTGVSCSHQFHTFTHTIIPITMDDGLPFKSFWKQHGKVPSFQLVVTHGYAGENRTKIKDPSVVESTVWHVFDTG